MSEYPDPDEEYELMYADELELLRENEETASNIPKKVITAKRSLDFSSPVAKRNLEGRTWEDQAQVTNNTNAINYTETPLTPNLVPTQEVCTNTTNKRTADDLFGDIGDIDFDELEQPSKRQKTEEENDLELINKIIECRKLKQILAVPSNRGNIDSLPVYNYKENISLNIPRWAFIPVTNSDGDRMYIKLESEDSWEKSLDKTAEQPSLRTAYASTWEEARKILEEKQKTQIDQDVQSQSLPDMDLSTTSANLWVDKYRPHSYLDLLSEEPINRTLLHWLHLWDKVVFKKEIKTKEPQQRNSFSKRTGQFHLRNSWHGKKQDEPELDPDGRPRLKVALLCGPPGVGKTTLAHLLARIAGYRPVELNASDERSTEAFSTALKSATLMQSVLDADKRPNCLILDEIDGAPLATVELLVKWCTATTEGGKKKGKAQPLRRPVIAICNDQYATALRPLRPVSLVLQVGGVSLPRLTARLSRVAECEGLRAPPRVLAALAARAQGDVRAAIQVLSFIRARANAQLKIEDVENASIGTKDCSKSLMQALIAVFTVNDKDPDAVLKTVQAAGEYDRLAEGVFENYLTARMDGRLLIPCETLSWLRLYDTIHSWILRNQNYSLYGALPLCIAMCHRLLASRTPQKLKFPILAQEMSRKQAELSSIIWSVRGGCRPTVSSSVAALRLDVLPLLPYILAPTLRSANVQLCSESERKTLRMCAGAMCDYGLQYVQQRTPEGLYAFMLEPDIYKVAFLGSEERVRPPPAVRQAIAREQQLELIRRNEEMVGRVNSSCSNIAKPKTTGNKENTDGKNTKEARLPNHLQRLKPKELRKTNPQVHKDFFGRIVPIASTQRTDAVNDLISSSSVFYQYREGFNNAVRRNVRLRDLL